MPRFSGSIGVSIVLALASLSVPVLRPTMVWAEPVGSLTGMTICVDPGHPSETSEGCKGLSGYKEMTAVWEVGQKLKVLLQQAGANVVLTKGAEKEYVTNRRRAEIANQAHADLMIRLHCDTGGGSGFAVYYPDRQGTKYGVTGPKQSVIKASHQAAEAFYRGMKKELEGILSGRGIYGDSATYVGSRQGALTGSIFSQVPVLCVEMVMLSNASDEKFIGSKEGQEKMSLALKAGIEAFASSTNMRGAPACGDLAADEPTDKTRASAPVSDTHSEVAGLTLANTPQHTAGATRSVSRSSADSIKAAPRTPELFDARRAPATSAASSPAASTPPKPTTVISDRMQNDPSSLAAQTMPGTSTPAGIVGDYDSSLPSAAAPHRDFPGPELSPALESGQTVERFSAPVPIPWALWLLLAIVTVGVGVSLWLFLYTARYGRGYDKRSR